MSAVGELDRSSTEDDWRYWVAFSLVPGLGPVRFERLVRHYGSLAEAWVAPPSRLRAILDERTVEHIVEVRSSGVAERTWARLEETGIRAVCLNDVSYPRLLKEIPAPPPVLYVKGSLRPEDNVAVAIVGTRKMTGYGRAVAGEIARELSRAGVTVISGLALGIDGSAHRGALEGGGRTIAVLGCGVNVAYPASHQTLAAQIVENGALVSTHAPDRKPEPANFPARNRIISGLSLGTVVVEAPEKSGALITVEFAADQGREVFVVPGNVNSAASTGSNALLRDGARPVRNAEDILEDLNLAPLSRRAAEAAVQSQLPLEEGERRLLSLLTAEPQHIDEIAAALNRPIQETASELLLLELKGLVRNTGAQHYARG